MGVDTRHGSYVEFEPQWERARDCYKGGDAVKKKTINYLPMLGSHKRDVGGESSYDEYALRALFYNAIGRTVDGFAGAIFQREPKFEMPSSFKDDIKDITRTGITAEMFALKATREILTTGRYGILVEMPEVQKAGLVDRILGRRPVVTAKRPYWIGYTAEDIVNWDTARVDGETVLAWVVLREYRVVRDPKDRFSAQLEEQYRVLELEQGGVTSTTWTIKAGSEHVFEEGTHIPVTRRGQQIDVIPFACMGPTSVSMDVEKPPLIDLVDVNLSHFRTMADLEHGRHFCALPQPWVKGQLRPESGPLSIGSSKAWILAPDGGAGMLEFTGQGLGALEKADEQKRKMMATLGARLLEEQPDTQETAAAVGMRHSGEHATLRTVAAAIEQGMGDALRLEVWWQGVESDPRAVKALCELNKDFFAVRMTPVELQALVGALQEEAISFATFYSALQRGEYARPGITADEEMAEIKREVDLRPQPPAPPVIPPVHGGAPPTPGAPPKPPLPGAGA